MKFDIDIGEAKKQRLEFSFNQLLGRTVIRSNGQVLMKNTRHISEPLFDTHFFHFDEGEKIDVRIEKQRKLIFASRYCVYVNNRLAGVYQGV